MYILICYILKCKFYKKWIKLTSNSFIVDLLSIIVSMHPTVWYNNVADSTSNTEFYSTLLVISECRAFKCAPRPFAIITNTVCLAYNNIKRQQDTRLRWSACNPSSSIWGVLSDTILGTNMSFKVLQGNK